MAEGGGCWFGRGGVGICRGSFVVGGKDGRSHDTPFVLIIGVGIAMVCRRYSHSQKGSRHSLPDASLRSNLLLYNEVSECF